MKPLVALIVFAIERNQEVYLMSIKKLLALINTDEAREVLYEIEMFHFHEASLDELADLEPLLERFCTLKAHLNIEKWMRGLTDYPEPKEV